MKCRVILNYAIAAVLLLVAIPSQAVQMAQCTSLSSDLNTTSNNIATVETNINLLISDLNTLSGYVQIPLDVQKDVNKAKETADMINDLLSDLALLGELNPEIAEPLNNTSSAITNITQNVIDPTNNTINNVVDTLHLQQIHDALKAAANNIGTYAKTPLDDGRNDLLKALNATDDSMNLVNRMPAGACQNQAANALDMACQPIDVPVKQVNTTTNGVFSTVNGVMNDVNSAVNAFDPFNQVRTDLEDLNYQLSSIERSLRGMRSLLNRRIYIRIKSFSVMITVASFSVQDVLNDWRKVVYDVKHYLGIGDAEAWIRKQIARIMRSETNALKREIRGLIDKNVNIAFNLNSVSNLMGKIQNEVGSVKAKLNSDVSSMTTSMTSAANRRCQ